MPSFNYPIHTQLEETDMGGIIYHSVFLNYMERARSAWLVQHGLTADKCFEQDFHFVISAVELKYHRPLMVHQDILSTCEVQELGTSSIKFRQTIIDANHPNTVYCSGAITIVCVSLNKRPIPVPPVIKEFLQHE